MHRVHRFVGLFCWKEDVVGEAKEDDALDVLVACSSAHLAVEGFGDVDLHPLVKGISFGHLHLHNVLVSLLVLATMLCFSTASGASSLGARKVTVLMELVRCSTSTALSILMRIALLPSVPKMRLKATSFWALRRCWGMRFGLFCLA